VTELITLYTEDLLDQGLVDKVISKFFCDALYAFGFTDFWALGLDSWDFGLPFQKRHWATGTLGSLAKKDG
jgi:hypothetical protein